MWPSQANCSSDQAGSSGDSGGCSVHLCQHAGSPHNLKVKTNVIAMLHQDDTEQKQQTQLYLKWCVTSCDKLNVCDGVGFHCLCWTLYSGLTLWMGWTTGVHLVCTWHLYQEHCCCWITGSHAVWRRATRHTGRSRLAVGCGRELSALSWSLIWKLNGVVMKT